MKNILLITALVLGFANISFAQYDGIQAAVKEINSILATAPTALEITVEENGATKKNDIANSVVYDFNLNDVSLIQYEKQLNQFMVKFACASGKKCFHCEENLGGGIIHYIEASSEADAKKLVEAFMYLKKEIKFY